MKIALFSSAFHPAVGGVEEVVRQLAHALKRNGHGVIVITNRWPRDQAPVDEFQGIPVFRLPLRAPDGSFKSRLTYRLTHHAVERAVARILREHQIEIIHVHCVSANALYGMRASRELRLPLVVTSHSERTMDATRIFERSAFMQNVLRESLTTADFVTACSKNTLDDLQHFMNGGMCPRNRVIYNGIDLSEFSRGRTYTHPRPYILALGRFVRPKGFDVLLKAYAKSAVAQTHDLVLAGDGPEQEALEALIGELVITSRVHLPGRVNRETALALMENSSFFVLSSRHEGFPMVCLEAMGASKAIVATAVGGVPESVVNEVSGLLVPKEDINSLAEALTRVANDANLSERFGSAGRRRVEQLSWQSIVTQYMCVYQEVGVGHETLRHCLQEAAV
jgi:glycogen(starch) synthase